MARFIEIALGLPTAFFTTLLLISLGFWVIGLVTGIDGVSDLDIDLDGGDVDLESSAGFLAALGLNRIPISLVFTVISLTGWLTSLTLVSLLSNTGSVGILAGLLVALGALLGGIVVANPVAQLLAPLFAVHPAVQHRDLLGRFCIVKTGRVDTEFGQGEVTDAEFGTHIVQIRSKAGNGLTAGSRALLVDVNADGVFHVVSDELGD
ncbi:MAG: hypothetical protein R2706_06105 [Acidimicrobiales bacterium]